MLPDFPQSANGMKMDSARKFANTSTVSQYTRQLMTSYTWDSEVDYNHHPTSQGLPSYGPPSYALIRKGGSEVIATYFTFLMLSVIEPSK